uniref:isochorismatase family protein n=1 Tax=Vibrio vulnificus TaxID=672 RepID=UPI0039B45B04
HMCVNSTARGAFNLGYAPTVVASATATRDLPLPDGSVVRGDALQPATTPTMRDLFAAIAPTADAVLG